VVRDAEQPGHGAHPTRASCRGCRTWARSGST
jgi:hypothetical protein